MLMKDILLMAMAEQLRETTKARIAKGEKTPFNAEAVIDATCKGLQDNPLTAATVSNVGMTRQDVSEMVHKVYKELNCG